ncbi:hypothetical protein [Comamonas odontotermitis]|uniref:hypothetical protein n=1 Tax=Comamonas odontotermitis TaxID=379895 RepID=UPI001CC73E2C|nr:hypothetical protein [Comamonas odontotermitis]UBB15390.1 hypothetical protein LAD35_10945 [Comamonas odontotermitis]
MTQISLKQTYGVEFCITTTAAVHGRIATILFSAAPEWEQGLGLLGATVFWFEGAGVSRKLYL